MIVIVVCIYKQYIGISCILFFFEILILTQYVFFTYINECFEYNPQKEKTIIIVRFLWYKCCMKSMKMFSGCICVLPQMFCCCGWLNSQGHRTIAFLSVGSSDFEKHTASFGVWTAQGLKALSSILADFFCPQRKLITDMDQSTAALTWKLTLLLLLYHNSTERTRLSHHAGAEAKTAVSWCSSLYLRSSCLTLQLRSQWDGPRRLF